MSMASLLLAIKNKNTNKKAKEIHSNAPNYRNIKITENANNL